MNKIRKILEKYLGTESEFGTVPRDLMFDDLSFDKLEKELQEYMDSAKVRLNKNDVIGL